MRGMFVKVKELGTDAPEFLRAYKLKDGTLFIYKSEDQILSRFIGDDGNKITIDFSGVCLDEEDIPCAVRYKNYLMLFYASGNQLAYYYIDLIDKKEHGIVKLADIDKDEQTQKSCAAALVFKGRLVCFFGESVYICRTDKQNWNKYRADIYKHDNAVLNCRRTYDASDSFTGCANYKGKPVIFKPHGMYTLCCLEGSVSLVEISDTGCLDSRSIQIIGDELIFLSQSGLMSYNGKDLKCISDQIPDINKIPAAKSIVFGRYYQIGRYVFDTETRIFTAGSADMIPLAVLNGISYYYGSGENCIYKEDLKKDSRNVKWWIKSTFSGNMNRGENVISRFDISLKPKTSVSFYINLSVDGKAFEQIRSDRLIKGSEKNISIIIPPCLSFEITAGGTGKAEIKVNGFK